MSILETIRLWWLPISFALTFVVGATFWAMRQRFVTRDEVDRLFAAEASTRKQVEGQISDLLARLVRIEVDLRHMPRAEEIAALKIDVAVVRETATATRREVESVASSINKLTDLVINKVMPQ